MSHYQRASEAELQGFAIAAAAAAAGALVSMVATPLAGIPFDLIVAVPAGFLLGQKLTEAASSSLTRMVVVAGIVGIQSLPILGWIALLFFLPIGEPAAAPEPGSHEGALPLVLLLAVVAGLACLPLVAGLTWIGVGLGTRSASPPAPGQWRRGR